MTYRPRWSYVLLRGAAVLFACVLGSLLTSLLMRGIDTSAVRISALVLGVMFSSIAVFRLRARKLVVHDDGVTIRRDRATIRLAWSDFVQVSRGSWGPLKFDVLEFTGGLLIPDDHYRGISPTAEKRIRHERADRSFEPGMYFADWRTGELGSVVVKLRQ